MLSPSYKTPPKEQREWKTIPEDVYQVAIEDINPGYKEYKGQREEVLVFQFIILDDGEFKGERLFKKMKPVVYDGANSNRPSYLYQIWKAAMKVEPTQEQLASGLTSEELNSLIGQQLRVSVKLSPPAANGKIYSNVEGVMQAKTLLELPKLKQKAPVEFKREEAEATVDYDDEHETEDVNDALQASKDPKDLPF